MLVVVSIQESHTNLEIDIKDIMIYMYTSPTRHTSFQIIVIFPFPVNKQIGG